MSVSSQGQLVGSEVAGQTHCSGFLNNVLCMWSELKFVVVYGILVVEEVLHFGFFCLFCFALFYIFNHAYSWFFIKYIELPTIRKVTSL